MATTQLISTMATPLLVGNATVVFEAIDPATGAAVSGVAITDPVLSGVNLSGFDATDQSLGDFQLVPGPNT
jgi:hypothetical protein